MNTYLYNFFFITKINNIKLYYHSSYNKQLKKKKRVFIEPIDLNSLVLTVKQWRIFLYNIRDLFLEHCFESG